MVAQRADQPAAQSGDSQSSRPAAPHASCRPTPPRPDRRACGRTLRFKATAGSIPLNDGDGALQAEVAYVAYAMGGDTQRPVTFVFNGGPGAASAYLGLGAIGPWRLPLDRLTVSTPPTLQPNAETWLDFTDLVFIDPPGTGYSRIAASGDDARRRFWSVDATLRRSRSSSANGSSRPDGSVGQVHRGRKLWRLSCAQVARKLQEQGVGIRAW